MRVAIAVLFLVLFCACGKTVEVKEDLPSNYTEMFKVLHLQFNKEYSYVERVNNAEIGHKGKIRFLLSDTSISETDNGYIVKDQFRLESFKVCSYRFLNYGRKKYNPNITHFINNAHSNFSFVNGPVMISLDSIENGSYYYYQYLIKE